MNICKIKVMKVYRSKVPVFILRGAGHAGIAWLSVPARAQARTFLENNSNFQGGKLNITSECNHIFPSEHITEQKGWT